MRLTYTRGLIRFSDCAGLSRLPHGAVTRFGLEMLSNYVAILISDHKNLAWPLPVGIPGIGHG